MVLDIEQAQPALLSHGQGDEIPDLDQLRLAEMLVQARPEGVVHRQIPGNGLGIGERGLLALIVTRRALEIDEVAVVLLDHALFCCLDRALVAAELAQHRARDIDPAQLLDGMIRHAVLEHIAPAVGEGPEHRRHVRADRLALRARRALARATVEFGEHRRVLDSRRIDVADAWIGHGQVSPCFRCVCANAAGRMSGRQHTIAEIA